MREKTTTERARIYGARSAKKVTTNSRILVDGKYWTHTEIAAELGITRGLLSTRYRREMKKPGPITLAGLAAV